jgi:UDPglucose 6-dehydrogenase
MKILVLGLGYVGTANAILLAQHNDVTCFDINNDRVDQINKKISPVEDFRGESISFRKRIKS